MSTFEDYSNWPSGSNQLETSGSTTLFLFLTIFSLPLAGPSPEWYKCTLELHDGRVRVVTIHTASGTHKRPVVKLALLLQEVGYKTFCLGEQDVRAH